ncbi:MAG: hypothetical protein ACSW8A_04740 [Lachnospiraceae bacterium]|jgi:hypothetical protein|uniref:Uncharacterized protein n=1 Tax=uncultured bacterium Contig26 TaxID=1393545 RepID=W0FLY8_9BACT|nr:hypothetical protein [uncultured bacterium Contig26]
MKRGWNMENIIEIRNRRITINTDMHREDYCKTAILFEVLDGSVMFSYGTACVP